MLLVMNSNHGIMRYLIAGKKTHSAFGHRAIKSVKIVTKTAVPVHIPHSFALGEDTMDVLNTPCTERVVSDTVNSGSLG